MFFLAHTKSHDIRLKTGQGSQPWPSGGGPGGPSQHILSKDATKQTDWLLYWALWCDAKCPKTAQLATLHMY